MYRTAVNDGDGTNLTNVTVSNSVISLPDPTGGENDPGALSPEESSGIIRLLATFLKEENRSR